MQILRLRIVSALLFVGIVVVVLAFVLVDSEDPVRATSVIRDDPAALYDTDPWFRETWVRGCVASGEDAAFC
jgi:hypothetical protein